MRRVTYDDGQRIKALYRSLRARLGGGDNDVLTPREWLAYQVGTNPAYISRMLNGEQRTGRRWQKLQSLLSDEELELIDGVAYRGVASRFGDRISA